MNIITSVDVWNQIAFIELLGSFNLCQLFKSVIHFTLTCLTLEIILHF